MEKNSSWLDKLFQTDHADPVMKQFQVDGCGPFQDDSTPSTEHCPTESFTDDGNDGNHMRSCQHVTDQLYICGRFWPAC